MGRQRLREQAVLGLRVGSLIALVTGGLLGAIYLITRQAGIPYTDLTRDPAATLDGAWYTGALSNSAIAFLLVGCGIALFSASLLPRSSERSVKGLLNALAVVMIVVAADDLFMLHERVYPQFGISSVLASVAYAVALVAVLWAWRRVILGATDYVFLFLAGLGMAISVAVDIILEERLFILPLSGELIEDPAKIVGMVFMTFYFARTSRQALQETQRTDFA